MNSNFFEPIKQISAAAWGLFVAFVLLLIFFDIGDVYHQHFFSTGPTVVLYNCARLLFIPCLMWLFYTVGYWALKPLSRNINAYSTESALLAFFSGVGIWHIILLFVGFAGFYYHYLMLVITSLIFLISLPRVEGWIQYVVAYKAHIYWPGLLLLIAPTIALLMVKGLYPAGGHDYYNHYFHFYSKVIDSGSILPNEVWYHFYYSKGAALFFLSMLLTDPLAPQLATTAMIFAGAAIVFQILKTAPWRLLPWIGAALYIAFLIYTPGPYENMRQGGWGDFEKLHEPAAVLMLSIIWITIGLAKTQTQHWQRWGITLLLAVSALILISPVMAVFAGAYITMAMLYFIIRRQINAALWAFAGIVMSASWLVTLLIINYLLTGLPQDQGLFIFWPIINFNKIKEWGVSFELLETHWALTGLVANKNLLTLSFIPKLVTYLRLGIWGPLLILALILLSINLFRKQWRHSILQSLDKESFFACAGFLSLVILVSMLIGRDQQISYYRFSTFTYAPMLCFCLLLLGTTLRHWILHGIFIVWCGFAGWMMLMLSTQWVGTNSLNPTVNFLLQAMAENYEITKIISIKNNSMAFIAGKYSVADAYRHQEGWPGRMPWGGIYPPIEAIWRQLPHNTRVWSMHVHSYCMLPNCKIESKMSYRFSPHAEQIYFGNPSVAKKYLINENLNYFFVAHSLTLTDSLPLAPLFSPTHIANYLGIAWTDGDNTLLTWKEQARYPINSIWLKRYKQQVDASLAVKSFPYHDMIVVMASMHSGNRPKLTDLPWYRAGW